MRLLVRSDGLRGKFGGVRGLVTFNLLRMRHSRREHNELSRRVSVVRRHNLEHLWWLLAVTPAKMLKVLSVRRLIRSDLSDGVKVRAVLELGVGRLPCRNLSGRVVHGVLVVLMFGVRCLPCSNLFGRVGLVVLVFGMRCLPCSNLFGLVGLVVIVGLDGNGVMRVRVVRQHVLGDVLVGVFVRETLGVRGFVCGQAFRA